MGAPAPFVLVVSDNETFRSSLVEALEASRISAGGLSTVRPQLERLSDWPAPTVMVLNIGSPSRQVVELQRKVRERIGDGQCAEVLLVSGYRLPAHAHVRVHGVLPKPFSVDDLLFWVRSVKAEDGQRALLVVEDDHDIREAIAEVLASEDVPYEIVHDGNEALAKLRERPGHFHTVLTDVSMPRMDGWDFINLLNGEHLPEQPRIIVMSASLPPLGMRGRPDETTYAQLVRAVRERIS